MNYWIIAYIMGWVLNFEGAFLLLPALTAFVYGEKEGYAFLICSLLSFVIGGLIVIKKPSNKRFYAREGFVVCSMTWIVISLVGAIPFVLTCFRLYYYRFKCYYGSFTFTSLYPSLEKFLALDRRNGGTGIYSCNFASFWRS